MKLMRYQRPDVWTGSAWEPWTDLRNEINRLFDYSIGGQPFASEFFEGWTPAMDLYEDHDNLVVHCELPGMKKEDIDISFQDGTLTISGERKKEEEKVEKGETYRSERFVGRFHRTLTLPKTVDADKIKAGYKDGVLTVTLPKTEEAKPKHIEVSVK